MKYIFLFFILIILLTACTKTNEKEIATEKCINLCKAQLENNIDLNNGPCLSNEIIPNYVCDIAHSPRKDIDNIPENQCSAFRQGKATHFIEVNTECNLIKTF